MAKVQATRNDFQYCPRCGKHGSMYRRALQTEDKPTHYEYGFLCNNCKAFFCGDINVGLNIIKPTC